MHTRKCEINCKCANVAEINAVLRSMLLVLQLRSRHRTTVTTHKRFFQGSNLLFHDKWLARPTDVSIPLFKHGITRHWFHPLQCLRDGRACCPSLPKQLVICGFLRFQRRRHVVVSSRCFTGTGTGWFVFPTEWNLCKRVRARGAGGA